MHAIIIKLTVDWEEYEGVAPEIIVEDCLEITKGGVRYEILPNTPQGNKESEIAFAEWCYSNGYTFSGSPLYVGWFDKSGEGVEPDEIYGLYLQSKSQK